MKKSLPLIVSKQTLHLHDLASFHLEGQGGSDFLRWHISLNFIVDKYTIHILCLLASPSQFKERKVLFWDKYKSMYRHKEFTDISYTNYPDLTVDSFYFP